MVLVQFLVKLYYPNVYASLEMHSNAYTIQIKQSGLKCKIPIIAIDTTTPFAI